MNERDAFHYGVMLIELVSERKYVVSPLTAGVAIKSGKKTLKKRIEMIAKRPQASVSVILLIVLLLTGSIGCAFTGTDVKAATGEAVSTHIEDEEETGTEAGEQADRISQDMPSELPGQDAIGQDAEALSAYLYKYSGRSAFAEYYRVYESRLEIADVQVLPDTLRASGGRENDSFDGNVYHIDSLNIDLRIPEGYYLYVIPGMYLDSKGEKVTLEFVDEYVLTMQDAPEEQLISDIRAYQSETHIRNNEEFRGPGYILYSFKVFLKDYYPIENLFVPELRGNGERRSCGEYYCMMGLCPWVLRPAGEGLAFWCWHDGTRLDPDFEANTMTGTGPAFIREEDWPLAPVIGTIRSGTAGKTTDYCDYLMDVPSDIDYSEGVLLQDSANMFVSAANSISSKQLSSEYYTIPEASVCSTDWYQTYQNAVLELRKHPDAYQYDEQERNLIGHGMKFNEGRWYSDEAKDVRIRAFFYANLVCTGWDVSLEDVIIRLRDEEGKQYWNVFLRADGMEGEEVSMMDETLRGIYSEDTDLSTYYYTTETNKLFSIGHGVNILEEIDLQKAYEYAQTYLM